MDDRVSPGKTVDDRLSTGKRVDVRVIPGKTSRWLRQPRGNKSMTKPVQGKKLMIEMSEISSAQGKSLQEKQLIMRWEAVSDPLSLRKTADDRVTPRKTMTKSRQGKELMTKSVQGRQSMTESGQGK